MADYVLPHTIPQEDERLTLMSRMLDPQLFFRIEQLGIGSRDGGAWRSARATGACRSWLAERVGPTGHVVVQRHRHAIPRRRSRPEPRGPEDRCDRRPARRWLRPGAATERCCTTCRSARCAAQARRRGAARRCDRDRGAGLPPGAGDGQPGDAGLLGGLPRAGPPTRGSTTSSGAASPRDSSEHGFEDVDAHGETILFAGGSLPARYLALTMRELEHPLLGSGLIGKSTWTEAMGLFDNPAFWTWQNCYVTTTARKPDRCRVTGRRWARFRPAGSPR